MSVTHGYRDCFLCSYFYEKHTKLKNRTQQYFVIATRNLPSCQLQLLLEKQNIYVGPQVFLTKFTDMTHWSFVFFQIGIL